MNIPLDNLYHWVEGLAQHPVMLYVFRPHGSKDIFDLGALRNYDQATSLTPLAICHDQEPLDFDFYQFNNNVDRLISLVKHQHPKSTQSEMNELIEQYTAIHSHPEYFSNSKLTWLNVLDRHDWTILLHSEMNSQDVDCFSQVGFYPVYHWSHAVIARDWYRFAQFDSRLLTRKPKKTFLVYCRDWTPNREYRLKFLDLVVQQKLTENCVISTQHVNNQGVHLKDYQIQNSKFKVNIGEILRSVPDNNSPSSSSADYDVDDISSTRVSIVLETIVDSNKIHLTEKILRPIACAHPFVLAAGPGALNYLRSYGFKTYSDFWDESYDHEPDTILRLEKITRTMTQINNLTQDDWQKIQCVAEYNQRHFFSTEFIDQVTQELTQNLNVALDYCLENRGNNYWHWRKFIRRTGLIKQWPIAKSDWAQKSIRELRQHRLRRSQNNPSPGIIE